MFIIKKCIDDTKSFIVDTKFKNILIITLLFTLVQIVLGTQVRQFVDEQVKILGYNQMQLVLINPNVNFYVHRSFSIIILALNIYLFVRNKKLQLGYQKINWVMILIAIEILSGVAMYYLDFPFGSQPIHLVIASLLFGLQFYMVLETRVVKKEGV